MEKVKVTKEIFDALENFVKRGKNLKADLNYHVCTNYGLDEKELILRHLSCKTLVDIAYCGYELEEKKEDELLKLFNYHKSIYKKDERDKYDTGFMEGMVYTLSIMDIKVKGIND